MKPPSQLLAEIQDDGLLRVLKHYERTHGTRVSLGDRELVNFASNDYLGLARHPAVMDAMIEGIRHHGTGATASRLVCGGCRAHRELEESLAVAKGTQSALVFSSGYATAMGCMPVIIGKEDIVILDKLSHACLVDAARSSGARMRVFPHNDACRLDAMLRRIRERDPRANLLVVTESVFSMDGDVCPLRNIVESCEAHGAMLWLDEAHAMGVMGPNGLGLAHAEGLSHRIDFQMGTLGKAMGVSGGYLAASQDWIDLMVNRARSFIYSTAPPAALACAAKKALEVMQSHEGDSGRTQLRNHLHQLGLANHPSAIVPMVLGTNEAVITASTALAGAGLLVPAIRFPTVPRGKARLRVCLSAAHGDDDVRNLAANLRALGIGF